MKRIAAELPKIIPTSDVERDVSFLKIDPKKKKVLGSCTTLRAGDVYEVCVQLDFLGQITSQKFYIEIDKDGRIYKIDNPLEDSLYEV